MTGNAMGQQEDVHDVVDAQAQGTQTHQDVAAQDIASQFLRRIDVHDTAAHQSRTDVYGKHNQNGTGIEPHTFPLQEAWHRDVKRIDALQIAGAHQRQQHAWMQDARLSCSNRMAEERRYKRRRAEDAVHPCQTQILYPVSRKESHYTSYHEMNNGRTAKRYEKNVFTHSCQ